jgi:hypothetical protein
MDAHASNPRRRKRGLFPAATPRCEMAPVPLTFSSHLFSRRVSRQRFREHFGLTSLVSSHRIAFPSRSMPDSQTAGRCGNLLVSAVFHRGI